MQAQIDNAAVAPDAQQPCAHRYDRAGTARDLLVHNTDDERAAVDEGADAVERLLA
jgi:hypothetical protein